VKFGDGCATVTDYKLPQPLVIRPGRRERGKVRSQDTGLVVLVMPGSGIRALGRECF
jgi:hypothetical protein